MRRKPKSKLSSLAPSTTTRRQPSGRALDGATTMRQSLFDDSYDRSPPPSQRRGHKSVIDAPADGAAAQSSLRLSSCNLGKQMVKGRMGVASQLRQS